MFIRATSMPYSSHFSASCRPLMTGGGNLGRVLVCRGPFGCAAVSSFSIFSTGRVFRSAAPVCSAFLGLSQSLVAVLLNGLLGSVSPFRVRDCGDVALFRSYAVTCAGSPGISLVRCQDAGSGPGSDFSFSTTGEVQPSGLNWRDFIKENGTIIVVCIRVLHAPISRR